MEFKDYYQILGVAKNANSDDIKKAYRKLARKYHPDISKETNADKHMRDINEAREVLADPEKRAAYDQLGNHYKAGQEFEEPAGWDSKNWNAGFEFGGRGFGGTDSAEFSDFFANLFGQARSGFDREGRQRDVKQRGEDRHASILIDLIDAYEGATRTITLKSQERDSSGRLSLKEHSINVKIPAGVKEGQHIRLVGKGSPGAGGGADGDLYLEIHFKPNPHYRIEGHDVHQTLRVTPWEAALGATIEVQTPSGIVNLTIPAGSQSGRKLRLKGRGIPGPEVGDLYFVLEVILPSADNANARRLYETMARELAFNPRYSSSQHHTKGV